MSRTTQKTVRPIKWLAYSNDKQYLKYRLPLLLIGITLITVGIFI